MERQVLQMCQESIFKDRSVWYYIPGWNAKANRTELAALGQMPMNPFKLRLGSNILVNQASEIGK
jgi:hypothetical protein